MPKKDASNVTERSLTTDPSFGIFTPPPPGACLSNVKPFVIIVSFVGLIVD